ncbi:hypothetical protein O6H91_19G026300 [Diphasiastrum complanatum]|uniref:Uncharacterized protein n=1 Tax=Diphasiastrum complanatum TaxID=34168 RepID=A0ACC2ATV2_DIPCM|nr:hypothetical protein O6H91_19G026300 [Diphasiastrum complanatum]
MATERRLGVGLDFSPYSKNALQWTLDNMAKEGDYLLLVAVVSSDSDAPEVHLWGDTGSPLIPFAELEDPNLLKRYGVTLDAEILSTLELAEREKKVIVVLKVYYGDARDKLCDAVGDIPLDHLTLGSRGLGTLKRALLGSVSNYVVNNAQCPVTVVKLPEGSTTSKH